MSETIVIGHRNPDTDSACAAYCYAHLKNSIDPTQRYIAAVAGPLQAQARFVFEHAGVEPPVLVKDIRPRVGDVVGPATQGLQSNETILGAMRKLDGETLTVLPVFGRTNEFKGIVGIHEVASFFVAGALEERPHYTIIPSNLPQAIPGRFWHQASQSAGVEFSAPVMIGAMTFETYERRLNDLLPEKPVLITGLRDRIISHAIEQQLPAIIITGMDPHEDPPFDFSSYQGLVYISHVDTAETVRLLRLSVPVKHIMNRDPLTLTHDDLFDQAKKILLTSEYRGLPVTKDGAFLGLLTRQSLIEKPRKKIILVDHNELSQSIPGADEAEIVEIIDHHRLGTPKTSTPIYVYSKPVGSSCTIIFGHYRMYNVFVTRELATLMLSGILSDTMLLKSPTTTLEDRQAARDLAAMAGVSIEDYGQLMLGQIAVLQNIDPEQVVNADFKEYLEGGLSLGIGQIEVGTLDGIAETIPRLRTALERLRDQKKLHWTMLLVTDVMEDRSVLVCTSFPEAERELMYESIGDSVYDLPDVLSRKKQLLPEILRVVGLVTNLRMA